MAEDARPHGAAEPPVREESSPHAATAADATPAFDTAAAIAAPIDRPHHRTPALIAESDTASMAPSAARAVARVAGVAGEATSPAAKGAARAPRRLNPGALVQEPAEGGARHRRPMSPPGVARQSAPAVHDSAPVPELDRRTAADAAPLPTGAASLAGMAAEATTASAVTASAAGYEDPLTTLHESETSYPPGRKSGADSAGSPFAGRPAASRPEPGAQNGSGQGSAPAGHGASHGTGGQSGHVRKNGSARPYLPHMLSATAGQTPSRPPARRAPASGPFVRPGTQHEGDELVHDGAETGLSLEGQQTVEPDLTVLVAAPIAGNGGAEPVDESVVAAVLDESAASRARPVVDQATTLNGFHTGEAQQSLDPETHDDVASAAGLTSQADVELAAAAEVATRIAGREEADLAGSEGHAAASDGPPGMVAERGAESDGQLAAEFDRPAASLDLTEIAPGEGSPLSMAAVEPDLDSAVAEAPPRTSSDFWETLRAFTFDLPPSTEPAAARAVEVDSAPVAQIASDTASGIASPVDSAPAEREALATEGADTLRWRAEMLMDEMLVGAVDASAGERGRTSYSAMDLDEQSSATSAFGTTAGETADSRGGARTTDTAWPPPAIVSGSRPVGEYGLPAGNGAAARASTAPDSGSSEWPPAPPPAGTIEEVVAQVAARRSAGPRMPTRLTAPLNPDLTTAPLQNPPQEDDPFATPRLVAPAKPAATVTPPAAEPDRERPSQRITPAEQRYPRSARQIDPNQPSARTAGAAPQSGAHSDDAHVEPGAPFDPSGYEAGLGPIRRSAAVVNGQSITGAMSVGMTNRNTRYATLLPRSAPWDVHELEREFVALADEMARVLPSGHEASRRARHLLEKAQSIFATDPLRTAEVDYYLAQVRAILQRSRQTMQWAGLYRQRTVLYLGAWGTLSFVIAAASFYYGPALASWLGGILGWSSEGFLDRHAVAFLFVAFIGALGGALGGILTLNRFHRRQLGFMDRKYSLRGLILPPMGLLVGGALYTVAGLIAWATGGSVAASAWAVLGIAGLAFLAGFVQEIIYGTRE